MGCVHAHEPNFYVSCGINSCCRSYTNLYSFKKHLYRKHRLELEFYPFSESFRERDDHTGTQDSDVSEEPPTHMLSKRTTALLLLKTREVRKVSQRALDEDLTIFVRAVVSSLEFEMKHNLELLGGEDTFLHAFNDVFHKYSTIDFFQGLNSRYLQEKYYRECLGMLVRLLLLLRCFHLNFIVCFKEPLEIKLGDTLTLTGNARPHLKRMLLKHPVIMEEVYNTCNMISCKECCCVLS